MEDYDLSCMELPNGRDKQALIPAHPGFLVQTRPGGGGRGEAGTNYRDLAGRKGARGPNVLHNILSLSAVPLSVNCTN